MSDKSLAATIERLVAEEHELQRRQQRDRTDFEGLREDHDRTEDVRVELGRCWDLLRQRRALRGAGGDPDDAAVRDPNVVEKHWQ
jgi:hypothetical protein